MSIEANQEKQRKRRVMLMRVVDEQQGAIGLYTRFFLDHLEKNQQSIIQKAPQRSWVLPKDEQQTFFPFFKLKKLRNSPRGISKGNRRWLPKTYVRDKPFGLRLYVMSDFSGDIRRLFSTTLEDLFSDKFLIRDEVTLTGEFTKLRENEFINQAQQAYFGNSPFISDPKIILADAIDTMHQVTRWMCMHCKTPEEMITQMEAMLKPTIDHPYEANKKISPFEMLALGNNGDIGSVIYSSSPEYVGPSILSELYENFNICAVFENPVPIVKMATEDDPSIIDPQFVKLWYGRKLDVGGCPIMLHNKRLGGLFMQFGEIYVSYAKAIMKRDNELNNQATQKEVLSTNVPPERKLMMA